MPVRSGWPSMLRTTSGTPTSADGSACCAPTARRLGRFRGWASPHCGDGPQCVRRQDQADTEDQQRRSDLNPGDPVAAQPGENELSHACRDHADDDQDRRKPQAEDDHREEPQDQHAPLGSQHPEAEANDEDRGPDSEIGLHSLRDQPGRAQRRQHGDQNDAARVRQRDEDSEDEGVDRSPPHADDVRGRDGLAVSRRRRVQRSQPEARHQVPHALKHRCPRPGAAGRAAAGRPDPAALDADAACSIGGDPAPAAGRLSRGRRMLFSSRGAAPARRRRAVKAAAVVADILKREGVQFLIGYPVNPVIEAAAEADIRTIIVRQERTGLHMCDAVSRVTSGERIGVFAMQHGPGSENSFGGVAQAYGDSVPIVVLPAGYPRRLLNIPPNFSSFLNYQHVTKWAEQVILADAVPDAMRRAFTQVKNGRPRPVLCELPWDLLREEVPDGWTYTPAPRLRSAPDPKSVSEVAAALVAAERPVFYAGQGVNYAKAWTQLRDLAELIEAPVTTSLQGKSAFPDTHALSLGSGGRSISKQLHHFLTNADLIFGIGCSFASTNYGVPM